MVKQICNHYSIINRIFHNCTYLRNCNIHIGVFLCSAKLIQQMRDLRDFILGKYAVRLKKNNFIRLKLKIHPNSFTWSPTKVCQLLSLMSCMNIYYQKFVILLASFLFLFLFLFCL